MSVMADRYNIQSYSAALAEGLSPGDRIHVGVCGNQISDDLSFLRFFGESGIVVVRTDDPMFGEITILWGDIVELWSLEEKPNPFFSDVPEVAEVLTRVKSAVQMCVKDNNARGVTFLLSQIPASKRAESLFKEAHEVLAGIRI